MIEPCKSERVIVNRGIGSAFVANTTHILYADKDENGKIVRGDYLGTGIRDDRGFDLYAQSKHLSPA